MPPLKKNQCSARWLERPETSHCSRTAVDQFADRLALRPHRSAPSSAERALSYIANPSWCSATGTTNCAPARRKSATHSSASNRSIVNCGMKSL